MSNEILFSIAESVLKSLKAKGLITDEEQQKIAVANELCFLSK